MILSARTLRAAAAGLALFVGGFAAARLTGQQQPRVFELRTYTTHDGKLDALNARFRDHTTRLFQKHGMTNVVYGVPMDEPKSQNTLVYLLAYPSREAAKASWEAFRSDPGWTKARTESEKGGPINQKVESLFFTPTDYSPMK